MKKFATLSVLAFALATTSAFAQTTPAQPAAGEKTGTPAAKSKKPARHHKKITAKGAATTPAPVSAQK